MTRPGIAERVVDRWVRVYTLGVPRSLAAERRNEVLSDVWEQRAAEGDAWDLLRRAVAGAPADLTWRGAKGIIAPWLRLAVRLALLGGLLLRLAVIQHSTGHHTFIGNAMYVSWFLCAFAAVAAGAFGAWRRYKK